MNTGRTQARGTGRGGHSADRRAGCINELRSTPTRRAGWTGRIITTIAVILALIGGAGPAGADVLVTNINGASIAGLALSEYDVAQPFTTGGNTTGYQLESISIRFLKGFENLEGDTRQVVYVYVYGDGNGQPNHNDQIAVLTINGREYGSPKTGENKYIVWEKNGCCPKTTGVHLDPGARYWVFVWAGRSDTGVIVDNTSGNKGGEADWRIEGARVKPEGSAYSKYTDEPTEMRIQVEGKTNPAVEISISDATATEGTDATMDFVVSLSQATSGVVKMWYSAGDETAEAGTDFEFTVGWLTFQPGETEKTISVPILDDTVAESNETLNLTLSELTGATFSDGTGVGTIINAASVEISISDVTVTEGNDETADFVVTLSRSTTGVVKVHYATFEDTANGGDPEKDYDLVNGFLTFQPGETEKTISVPITDDTRNEPSERFFMNLYTIEGPAVFANPNSDGEGQGIGTILNTEILTASFRTAPTRSHSTSTSRTTSRSPRPRCATTRSRSRRAT